MNIILKRKVILIGLMVLIFVLLTYVCAASSSISASKTTLNIGESATVTLSGSDVTGKFNVTSSNSSVVSISSSTAWIENGSTTITATSKSAGTAVISLTPVDVSKSSDGTDITSSLGTKTLSIKVNAPTTPTTTTKSTNAYLKTLRLDVDGLTPAFIKTTTEYSVIVLNTVNSINVTATTEDTKAKYVVTGNTNLVNGENIISVKVVAEDGKTTKTYNIKVTKVENPALANANLLSINLDNAKLDKEFDPTVLEYVCEVENDVEKLNISPLTENASATINVTGNENFKVGENKVSVEVTAVDGVTKKIYTITVNKKEEVAAITNIQTNTPWYNNITNSITNYVKNIDFGNIFIISLCSLSALALFLTLFEELKSRFGFGNKTLNEANENIKEELIENDKISDNVFDNNLAMNINEILEEE